MIFRFQALIFRGNICCLFKPGLEFPTTGGHFWEIKQCKCVAILRDFLYPDDSDIAYLDLLQM